MHPALVLATITVLVSGSDPATEKRVRAAFDRAPECLRGSMDDGELRVVPGSLNAVFVVDESDNVRDILGSGNKTPTPRRVDQYIGVYDRLLVDADRIADESAQELVTCALPGELEVFFGNLDRVVLHEIAHAFHYDVRGGGKRADVNQFLDIRWRGAYEDWTEDRNRIRIQRAYRAAQKRILKRLSARTEPTPAELEQVCALQRELAEKFGDMPSRMPGDFHAFTESDGAEYFAIAIETLVYAPDVFCKSYTREEIAWLKDVLGECLSQLKKRAACYDAMPAAGETPRKPHGAGIRRD